MYLGVIFGDKARIITDSILRVGPLTSINLDCEPAADNGNIHQKKKTQKKLNWGKKNILNKICSFILLNMLLLFSRMFWIRNIFFF